ncbi:MAG: hypothetical protein H7177_00025 [Rhizobacter sp.]|nr:hypothetical protein [Bacteriovorax sp.]
MRYRLMKKFAVIVLFLAVGFGLFFLKKNFNIHSAKYYDDTIMTWDYFPKKMTDLNNPVEFIFNLTDKKKNPIPNAKFEIEANMNHGGMVPIFPAARFIKDSTYQSSIKLTMLGEWMLFITITLPDGQIIKKEVRFNTN